jgi:hypothetical protein
MWNDDNSSRYYNNKQIQIEKNRWPSSAYERLAFIAKVALFIVHNDAQSLGNIKAENAKPI